MNFIEPFRAPEAGRVLAERIAREVIPGRSYRLMEFCGGHTHVLSRYGLGSLLPEQVRMIHGPGCPVCVLPVGRLEQAIRLACEHDVMLCSYGDTLRVPVREGLTLFGARARGADVRMVYSVRDALALARANPQRQVVFLAIGFETTTPPTAVAVLQAVAEGLQNFSILCNHVLTPPAMRAILDAPGNVAPDGFVGPAHVSAVIGTRPYAEFATHYGKPVVVAGFEPLDMLQAILMLMRQINSGRAGVENEFTRAVSEAGNAKAQALMQQVFELRDSFAWRGLGRLPHSALRLRPDYAAFDAEQRFGVGEEDIADHPGCECGAVLRGVIAPQDCKLFGRACTPARPFGACMVSSEGACAAHYTYGRALAA